MASTAYMERHVTETRDAVPAAHWPWVCRFGAIVVWVALRLERRGARSPVRYRSLFVHLSIGPSIMRVSSPHHPRAAILMAAAT